jgi:hypothetical protein
VLPYDVGEQICNHYDFVDPSTISNRRLRIISVAKNGILSQFIRNRRVLPL